MIETLNLGFLSSNGLRPHLVHKSQLWNLERELTG